MGFWGSVGKAASAVGKVAKDHLEQVNHLASEYEGESDDYLKRKFKKGNQVEQWAAGKVLMARGYTKETL